MSLFDIGETVICECEVKDDGTYVDPSTSMNIEISQANPYKVMVASTAMSKDSVGHYHYDLQTANYSAGKYEAKYIATDATRITIEKETFELE